MRTSRGTFYDRPVPPDWVARTRTALEALAAEFSVSEVSEFPTLLRCSLERIEIEPDALHQAALGLMLLDVCEQVVQAVHARLPPASCTCLSVAWEYSRALTGREHTDPRAAIQDWLPRFLAHVRAAHPATPAGEAASLIRMEPQRPWTLLPLAEMTGNDRSRLSRQFKKAFGVRPAEYVHLVRVTRAVTMFRTAAKVEAIASEVGYRSKKDFYAALKRWIGLTPSELRALRDDESRWLWRELRQRCLRAGEASPRQTFAIAGACERSSTPASRQPQRPPQSTPLPNT